jgi:hypothetical protein
MKVIEPPNRSPPRFILPMPKKAFRISLGEELIYVLPLIYDPDLLDINPKVTIKVLEVMSKYVELYSEGSDLKILKCRVP